MPLILTITVLDHFGSFACWGNTNGNDNNTVNSIRALLFLRRCKGHEINKVKVVSKIHVLQYFVTVGRKTMLKRAWSARMQLHGWLMVESWPDRAGWIGSAIWHVDWCELELYSVKWDL